MSSSISLASLILKGVLGSIGLGALLDEVRQLIGEPEDFGRGMGKVKIERYFGGSLEISFLNNAVVLIAVYLKRGVLSNGTMLQMNCDFPVGIDSNEKNFFAWLDREGIVYQVYGDDEQSSSWKLNNGVVVTFVDSGIESIQVS
jgi:hypothetical protein